MDAEESKTSLAAEPSDILGRFRKPFPLAIPRNNNHFFRRKAMPPFEDPNEGFGGLKPSIDRSPHTTKAVFFRI